MEGRAAEDVFKDFRARRAGLIKALTTDVRRFYDKCNPAEENLCLYGLPNGSWEVNLPVDEVPPELPEPALGINFSRDGMSEQNWVSLVAVHSDSWLIAVAFYFGARFSFDKNERMRLFKMINDLPTIYEVVTGNAKPSKDQSANHNGSSKSKSSGVKARQSESQTKASKRSPPPPPPPREESESGDDDEGEDEEGQGEFCGVCGENDDGGDEFWIWCDTCEKWFHGKCVNTGAIILDETYQRCLLVKGWKGSSWSFPRGKKSKDEEDYACAIREVLEETGFDVSKLLKKEEYIEFTFRQQRVRLYIVAGVTDDTSFAPQTKKEISEIAWHRLDHLQPASNEVITHGVAGLKLYMVAPFLASLKSWISKHPAPVARRPDKPLRALSVWNAKTSSGGGNGTAAAATTESYNKKPEEQDTIPGNTYRSFKFNMSAILQALEPGFSG